MRRFLLVAASALALAAAAGATIVPQKGIAGVSLGMSKGKVTAVLGTPKSVKHGTNDFGKYTKFGYTGLEIIFQGNASATSIATTRRSEKTASGVGVGSTEVQVKAKVTGVKCKTEAGFRHCFVGKFVAGKRVTDFTIKRGHVTRVSVGIVID